MKLRKWSPQKSFLASIIGLFFASFLCFVNNSPVKSLEIPTFSPLIILADLDDPAVPITPDDPTDTPIDTEPTAEPVEETDPSIEPTDEPTDNPTEEPAEGPTEETTDESTEETPETCYDQVKGIGWLVCPTSGVIAQAVDSIYNIIERLLVVQPMTTDNESPIFTVWQYVRDLTNIVFIILIIVVIYSHLTGVGFDNYNIKKILPKLIITAILINLSYIICSALIDASNIIGASLRGFFENIETSIDASGEALVSWEALAGVLTGGGAIAGFAISASGGLGAFIWMLLPTLLAAILAIAVGLVTIAMRQAVVALLVMIAPLAFVCYMLPNTNKWFAKWKDTLAAMLIFFPMFSLLFGASHLAGWALIAKAQQDSSYFTLILGMAVQVVPLFLCIPMMKMSGSILGQVSNKLSGFASGINSRAKAGADDRRDTARARKLEEAARSRNFLSGARWAAYSERKKFERAESRAKNEESMKNTFSLYSNARRTGRRITGWDQNGRAIYAQKTITDKNGNQVQVDKVKSNRDMREEYRNREIKLATDADRLKTDNAMSNIEAYMRSTDAKQDKLIDKLASGQAQNYLEYRTQQSAKARNDRSDQRFYFEQVREASKLDASHKNYQKLIRAGAGADAFSDDDTISQNALNTVIADSYEAYEKERAETSKRYTTLFDKEVTKNVLDQYQNALRAHNIDAVVAAQNTLAKRGDYDKITKYLKNFMDQTDDEEAGLKFSDLGKKGRVELTSDFANELAANLLGMKDATPILGRLGKAINMETWRWTDKEPGEKGARQREYITFQDYVLGHKGDTSLSDNQNRTSMIELNYGTSLSKIDRTGFASVNEAMQYADFTQEDRQAFIHSIMPQLISAIPSYDSGGESIRSALGFMTGMKYDVDSAQWKKDKNLQIDTKSIELYISSLTDKDLNSFKTDAFQAICEAIAQSNGETCYNSKGEFSSSDLPKSVTKFLRGKVNKDALAVIQNNVNQGTNVGMKPKIMRAFGIDVPDTLPSSQTNL